MPNLRQRLPPVTALTAFEAAARLGNFTKAAAELHLTQAAVSRQIRQLEGNIGCKLFDRRRYDVVLTEPGRQLAATVSAALQSIAETTDVVRRSGSPDNEVTVFCEMALAARRLIPRLNDFNRQHPSVQLKIMTSNQPIEHISESIDVGLQYGARDPRRFEAIEISGDVVFPVCARSIADRFAGRADAVTLKEIRLLHFEQAGLDWLDWPQFLAAYGVTAQRKPSELVFDTYSNLIEAAIADGGVALGWGLAVEQCLKEGTLVKLSDLTLPAPDRLYALVPKLRKKSAATSQFIAWLTRSFAK